MEAKITFGQELPKESWHAVADDLQLVAPHLAKVLQQVNYEGMGDQDAEEFLTEMLVAVTAIRYVAEFAADKCRFIPL